MDIFVAFFTSPEVACLMGLLIGAGGTFLAALIISDAGRKSSRQDMQWVRDMIMDIFQQVRRGQANDMARMQALLTDILREVRQGAKQ